MLKYLLLLLGLACITGITVLVDHRSRPHVQPSLVGATSQVVHAPGRVEGATETLQLRPRISGRLVKLLVEEGQYVSKGDCLLQLDDDELKQQRDLSAAQLAVAEIQLERLRNGFREQEKDEAKALVQAKVAELRRAELDWQRTSGLRLSNATTTQEADRHRTDVEMLTAHVAAARARSDLIHSPPREEDVRIAEAHVLSARSALSLAQSRLDQAQLIALSSGRVLHTGVQVGELVGPQSEQPAIVMCDTSRLRVRAFVEELDALRVRIGATAKVSADGLAGGPVRGVVSRLAPQMTSKQLWTDSPAERLDTKVREVWIDLESRSELVPGLPVEVAIDLQEPADSQSEHFRSLHKSAETHLDLNKTSEVSTSPITVREID